MISGCASSSTVKKTGPREQEVRTFAEIYRQAKQGEKTEAEHMPAMSFQEPQGFVKPYIPVILPPRVIKVWVPVHILKDDKKVMVAGHWSFVMLEGTHWFIEGEEH
ncbi:MAG: hypothetical protein HQL22_06550 [Candidatus Omnitrophica bacterium]|nr:hypothetical protein [Candidatus Omnitrophota bacterium]